MQIDPTTLLSNIAIDCWLVGWLVGCRTFFSFSRCFLTWHKRYWSSNNIALTSVLTGAEKMSLCFRYIFDARLREEFFGLIQVTNLSGQSLASSILTALVSECVDAFYTCGQGYDRAANMSGRFNGVQVVIQRWLYRFTVHATRWTSQYAIPVVCLNYVKNMVYCRRCAHSWGNLPQIQFC